MVSLRPASKKATIAPLDGGDELTISSKDLLLVRRFGEPAYSTLTSLGVVRRGKDRPYHAVILRRELHDGKSLQITTTSLALKVRIRALLTTIASRRMSKRRGFLMPNPVPFANGASSGERTRAEKLGFWRELHLSTSAQTRDGRGLARCPLRT